MAFCRYKPLTLSLLWTTLLHLPLSCIFKTEILKPQISSFLICGLLHHHHVIIIIILVDTDKIKLWSLSGLPGSCKAIARLLLYLSLHLHFWGSSALGLLGASVGGREELGVSGEEKQDHFPSFPWTSCLCPPPAAAAGSLWLQLHVGSPLASS